MTNIWYINSRRYVSWIFLAVQFFPSMVRACLRPPTISICVYNTRIRAKRNARVPKYQLTISLVLQMFLRALGKCFNSSVPNGIDKTKIKKNRQHYWSEIRALSSGILSVQVCWDRGRFSCLPRAMPIG